MDSPRHRGKSKGKVSGKEVVKGYRDLVVWQRSHKLAIRIYYLSKKVRNRSLADVEIWKQVIRAAFSVPANIAEGYHSHYGKNYASHLEIARGSAGEADYWVFVLSEIGQLSEDESSNIHKEYGEVIAMLTGLIGKIRA